MQEITIKNFRYVYTQKMKKNNEIASIFKKFDDFYE